MFLRDAEGCELDGSVDAQRPGPAGPAEDRGARKRARGGERVVVGARAGGGGGGGGGGGAAPSTFSQEAASTRFRASKALMASLMEVAGILPASLRLFLRLSDELIRGDPGGGGGGQGRWGGGMGDASDVLKPRLAEAKKSLKLNLRCAPPPLCCAPSSRPCSRPSRL